MEISLLADHPDYAPKIAKWYFDEWAHIAPNITEDIVLEKVIEKSLNRDQIPLALVAREGGELVGVLELKIRENKNYPEYENWVGGVFTNPPNRGQGVAGQLLNKAKELAIDFGVKDLYLQCESFNIPLYLNHGFKALHQARHHDAETTIMVWHAAK
ncbi:GNAT family N-acetyltransferase [Photobacterium sanctipauli]|uniref:GNAT family N-acetyltransferase n=2 Tax=Photobacterium sanctipauli TaxID=1342794 RepID=A0A2T3NMY9_9GAMM|nr:GNAT family N-acetyltransferase [Photobacterium sanctipauli]PSW16884.1 GNAT family N-acetyltransferase [Photobacterium sanctipauli]